VPLLPHFRGPLRILLPYSGGSAPAASGSLVRYLYLRPLVECLRELGFSVEDNTVIDSCFTGSESCSPARLVGPDARTVHGPSPSAMMSELTNQSVDACSISADNNSFRFSYSPHRYIICFYKVSFSNVLTTNILVSPFTMTLADLPHELILHIANQIDSEKDILAFALLNRSFYSILIDFLYWHNVTYSKASALLWAATHGRLATAQQALNNGATVSVTGRHKNTPLHLATNAGQLQMVEFLLSLQGVDINCTNRHLETPLLLAAKEGHGALVRLLLAQPGVEPDVVDRPWHRHCSWWQTPLAYAAMNGHASIVQALLETGRVNVNYRDRQGRTPFSYAAGNGHVEVVRIMLTVSGIEVDGRCQFGNSPFYYAVGGNHEAVVRLLLDTEGGRPGPLGVCRITPLALAVEHGNEVIVKLLLDRGWSPDCPDEWLNTPLHKAARLGNDRILQMLKEKHKPFIPKRPPMRRRARRVAIKQIPEQ
jgi:ankyrin repeat protein